MDDVQGRIAPESVSIYHPYTPKRRGITDIYAS